MAHCVTRSRLMTRECLIMELACVCSDDERQLMSLLSVKREDFLVSVSDFLLIKQHPTSNPRIQSNPIQSNQSNPHAHPIEASLGYSIL